MNFGYQPIGSTNGVEIFHDTTIEAEDSLTWTHGKHSIHAGFEYYHYIMNDVYAGNSGRFGPVHLHRPVHRQPELVRPVRSNGTTRRCAGNAFADFLLGLPQEVQQGAPLNFHLRNSLFGAFVQDNYQASSNLTLTLASALRAYDGSRRQERQQERELRSDHRRSRRSGRTTTPTPGSPTSSRASACMEGLSEHASFAQRYDISSTWKATASTIWPSSILPTSS